MTLNLFKFILFASVHLHFNQEGSQLKLSTKEKIIAATLDLIHEKGYKGATTKEIAKKAEVNEVTLFRHFGSKKGIVEAIIKKYGKIDSFEHTFAKEITWDIESDLQMLVRDYQALLEQKKTVILLSLKEEGKFPELDALIKQIPQKYIKMLEDYFVAMVNKKKIKQIDPFTVATNFAFINFGYFLMKTRMNPGEETFPLDDFIENNIKIFTESLQ